MTSVGQGDSLGPHQADLSTMQLSSRRPVREASKRILNPSNHLPSKGEPNCGCQTDDWRSTKMGSSQSVVGCNQHLDPRKNPTTMVNISEPTNGDSIALNQTRGSLKSQLVCSKLVEVSHRQGNKLRRPTRQMQRNCSFEENPTANGKAFKFELSFKDVRGVDGPMADPNGLNFKKQQEQQREKCDNTVWELVGSRGERSKISKPDGPRLDQSSEKITCDKTSGSVCTISDSSRADWQYGENFEAEGDSNTQNRLCSENLGSGNADEIVVMENGATRKSESFASPSKPACKMEMANVTTISIGSPLVVARTLSSLGDKLQLPSNFHELSLVDQNNNDVFFCKTSPDSCIERIGSVQSHPTIDGELKSSEDEIPQKAYNASAAVDIAIGTGSSDIRKSSSNSSQAMVDSSKWHDGANYTTIVPIQASSSNHQGRPNTALSSALFELQESYEPHSFRGNKPDEIASTKQLQGQQQEAPVQNPQMGQGAVLGSLDLRASGEEPKELSETQGFAFVEGSSSSSSDALGYSPILTSVRNYITNINNEFQVQSAAAIHAAIAVAATKAASASGTTATSSDPLPLEIAIVGHGMDEDVTTTSEGPQRHQLALELQLNLPPDEGNDEIVATNGCSNSGSLGISSSQIHVLESGIQSNAPGTTLLLLSSASIPIPASNTASEGGTSSINEPQTSSSTGQQGANRMLTTNRSIFEGASKDQILEYLEDARDRVPEILMAADDVMVIDDNELIVVNQLDANAPATPISIVEAINENATTDETDKLVMSQPEKKQGLESEQDLNERVVVVKSAETIGGDAQASIQNFEAELQFGELSKQIISLNQFGSASNTIDEDTGHSSSRDLSSGLDFGYNSTSETPSTVNSSNNNNSSSIDGYSSSTASSAAAGPTPCMNPSGRESEVPGGELIDQRCDFERKLHAAFLSHSHTQTTLDLSLEDPLCSSNADSPIDANLRGTSISSQEMNRDISTSPSFNAKSQLQIGCRPASRGRAHLSNEPQYPCRTTQSSQMNAAGQVETSKIEFRDPKIYANSNFQEDLNQPRRSSSSEIQNPIELASVRRAHSGGSRRHQQRLFRLKQQHQRIRSNELESESTTTKQVPNQRRLPSQFSRECSFLLGNRRQLSQSINRNSISTSSTTSHSSSSSSPPISNSISPSIISSPTEETSNPDQADFYTSISLPSSSPPHTSNEHSIARRDAGSLDEVEDRPNSNEIDGEQAGFNKLNLQPEDGKVSQVDTFRGPSNSDCPSKYNLKSSYSVRPNLFVSCSSQIEREKGNTDEHETIAEGTGRLPSALSEEKSGKAAATIGCSADTKVPIERARGSISQGPPSTTFALGSKISQQAKGHHQQQQQHVKSFGHGYASKINKLNHYFFIRQQLNPNEKDEKRLEGDGSTSSVMKTKSGDKLIEFQCPDCDQYIDVDRATIIIRTNHLSLLDDNVDGLAANEGTTQQLDQVEFHANNLASRGEISSAELKGIRKDSNSLTAEQLDRAYIAAINGLPLCNYCQKKRIERKEIISEFVETEMKYGRDLKILYDEFYIPLQIAGLLTKDQISGVFLNLEELLQANCRFSDLLLSATNDALEMNDIDYNTVDIGKIFLTSVEMLNAFEYYCIRQSAAACQLARLAKEKELLRVFLRVVQMENTALRRMNLAAFLMVPVQRVTKYPLLLNRLYKVTAHHLKDREALRDAQLRVELHLEHINQQTKGANATNKIWRRISGNLPAPLASANRRLLISAEDFGNYRLRKAAMDVLGWDREESQFIHSGELSFAPMGEFLSRTKIKSMRFIVSEGLLVVLGKPTRNYRPDLIRPNFDIKQIAQMEGGNGIREAALLLFRQKNGRFTLCHEPLLLSNCIFSPDCSQYNSDQQIQHLPNSTNQHHLPISKALSMSPVGNAKNVISSNAQAGRKTTSSSLSNDMRLNESSLQVNGHSNEPPEINRQESPSNPKAGSKSSSPSPPIEQSRNYSLASAIQTSTSSTVGPIPNLSSKQATSGLATASNPTILYQLITKVNSYSQKHSNQQMQLQHLASKNVSVNAQTSSSSTQVNITRESSDPVQIGPVCGMSRIRSISPQSSGSGNSQHLTLATSPMDLKATSNPTPGNTDISMSAGHHHYFFHNHHNQTHSEYEELFEIHEGITKESLLIRADTPMRTRYWLQMLRYHAKDLGQWRKRRDGLANVIMSRKK